MSYSAPVQQLFQWDHDVKTQLFWGLFFLFLLRLLGFFLSVVIMWSYLAFYQERSFLLKKLLMKKKSIFKKSKRIFSNRFHITQDKLANSFILNLDYPSTLFS